jgi:hypothetical protein
MVITPTRPGHNDQRESEAQEGVDEPALTKALT